MSTHTPGPWGFYTEPQPNGCPIVGSRGLMVAMLAHTVNQDDQRETALANARLIAAAPDLLEALQTMICQFESEIRSEYEGTSMLDGRLAEADHARAAIAKALGETK